MFYIDLNLFQFPVILIGLLFFYFYSTDETDDDVR